MRHLCARLRSRAPLASVGTTTSLPSPAKAGAPAPRATRVAGWRRQRTLRITSSPACQRASGCCGCPSGCAASCSGMGQGPTGCCALFCGSLRKAYLPPVLVRRAWTGWLLPLPQVSVWRVAPFDQCGRLNVNFILNRRQRRRAVSEIHGPSVALEA